jgi:hypothetical protein
MDRTIDDRSGSGGSGNKSQTEHWGEKARQSLKGQLNLELSLATGDATHAHLKASNPMESTREYG